MSAAITIQTRRQIADRRRLRVAALMATVAIVAAGIASSLDTPATSERILGEPVTVTAPPAPAPSTGTTSIEDLAGGPDLGPLRAD